MKKVLLIDDDPLITAMYEKHFRADGFEVRTTDTGEEGINAVRDFVPNAVLLDLNMPDVNGVQWLKEIRSDIRFARLPVVVFTAGTIGSQIWEANESDVNIMFKEGAVPRDVVKAVNAAITAGSSKVADR